MKGDPVRAELSAAEAQKASGMTGALLLLASPMPPLSNSHQTVIATTGNQCGDGMGRRNMQFRSPTGSADVPSFRPKDESQSQLPAAVVVVVMFSFFQPTS